MRLPVSPALVAGLAVAVLAGGPAVAQTPGPPRVTITSAPSRVPLRPPRRAAGGPTAIAKMAFDVQSWFGRDAPPDTLTSGARGAVVLARDLRLENRNYAVETPQLVMVVDRLRIGPNAVIDVSARQLKAPGGKIVVLAREITCESGGTLQLVTRGGPQGAAGGAVVLSAASIDGAAAPASPASPKSAAAFGRGRAFPGRAGGPGMRGVKPAPRPPASPPSAPVTLAPCITAITDGGPGATMTVRDHRTNPPTVSQRQLPPGPRGSAVAQPLRAAIQADSFVQTAWSMWALEWLEALQLDIYQASQRNDYPRLLALLRTYAAFDGPVDLVSSDMRPRYTQVLGELNEYRRTALPALSVEEISVVAGVVPQALTVFTEGATLRASLAPTHALAARADIGGRSVLGLIDYQPDRPDELAIEVEWELTVDPWAERLASAQLSKRGQQVDGVFSGWALEAKPLQEMGVRSSVATLLPGGRRLRVRFVVDAARANLVFWRLLNSAGVPWMVDWSFREADTGRTVTGTWAGPPLTLVRQRQTPMKLLNGSLVNEGTAPATVNYVRNEDGSFSALSPALRVQAGETVPLPDAVAAARPAAIPPEAVETAFDPERFAADFHVLNADAVVDRLVIRNTLPTSDPQRGVFDRLQITVTAEIEGDSSVAPSVMGPFELSATGTRGGEISIPTLRLARGARRVTVQGTAYYADGERTLKPTTFDTLTIAITADMFRE